MLRTYAFFLCLLLAFSLSLGSVAQAAEATCVEATAASTLDHFDGDGDQVPADSQKAYPHHHEGCHGHHIGVPAMITAAVPGSAAPIRAWPKGASLPALASTDPGLRPPQD